MDRILHLEGIAGEADAKEVKLWQERIARQLPPIIAAAGNSRLVCVENLDYPFEWCAALIDTFKLGVCMDIGHLLKNGFKVDEHLKKFLPLARIVHLHGLKDKKDHQALDSIPENLLRQWLNNLAAFRGVLTLEIFNLAGMAGSMQRLQRCLAADCS